ncbi:putative reverse transcriptase domain-containing protein, partial [Tanacetum coccineum]
GYNRDDNGNGNGDGGGNGNGNGLGGGNGDGNPNVNVGGVVPVTYECTYQDFLKCQSLIFKGTEGVVGLTRWFEKMETVFHISNCLQKNEIQKMETELWNLAVKGNDLSTYTQRFQELVLRYTKMVPDEEDRVEKFIGGLPDNIQGNKIRGCLKTISEITICINHPFKMQNIDGKNGARAYTVGNSEKKGAAVVVTAQRALVENQRVMTCFGCGGQGHYKSEYPKLKNQNRGNKASNNEARRRAYAL